LVKGQLDAWLVRPRPLLLQIAAVDFTLRRLGHVVQSALVAAIAIAYLRLGPGAIGWVGLGMFGGCAFFAGVLLLGAASQFWTLGHTAELQNMLTYGGSTILSYPISIYSPGLRRALIYGVPLAFVNYFPALAALGRLEASGHGAHMPWLSPLACGAVLGAGLWAFRVGVRHYESTGS
jgi:ABC-2 type transport system permease protein